MPHDEGCLHCKGRRCPPLPQSGSPSPSPYCVLLQNALNGGSKPDADGNRNLSQGMMPLQFMHDMRDPVHRC